MSSSISFFGKCPRATSAEAKLARATNPASHQKPDISAFNRRAPTIKTYRMVEPLPLRAFVQRTLAAPGGREGEWNECSCAVKARSIPVLARRRWSFEDPAEAGSSELERIRVFRRVRNAISERVRRVAAPHHNQLIVMPNDCLLRAWRDHEAELLGYLHGRLPEPHTAEDLLQDIFVKALGQGSRFCSLENSRAWLYRVTRNALADHLRLAHAQVELPDDLTEETEPTAPVESLADCLPRALTELSTEDCEAITLCDLEGMTQEEYARRKGLTLPGAKSRVQRARKRLRDHLTTACQIRFDAVGKVCCFVPRARIK